MTHTLDANEHVSPLDRSCAIDAPTAARSTTSASASKFGTFAKGEEDLRYYNAVVLYETGQYVDAQKELACALPFIQLTDDVARYRTKIESTVAQTARK